VVAEGANQTFPHRVFASSLMEIDAPPIPATSRLWSATRMSVTSVLSRKMWTLAPVSSTTSAAGTSEPLANADALSCAMLTGEDSQAAPGPRHFLAIVAARFATILPSLSSRSSDFLVLASF